MERCSRTLFGPWRCLRLLLRLCRCCSACIGRRLHLRPCVLSNAGLHAASHTELSLHMWSTAHTTQPLLGQARGAKQKLPLGCFHEHARAASAHPGRVGSDGTGCPTSGCAGRISPPEHVISSSPAAAKHKAAVAKKEAKLRAAPKKEAAAAKKARQAHGEGPQHLRLPPERGRRRQPAACGVAPVRRGGRRAGAVAGAVGAGRPPP
ncbi:MAG: hypothetical protein J3K34DRAFT_519059, partial [Monoraphidium minutum]